MVETEDGNPARPGVAETSPATAPEVVKRRWMWEALAYPDFALYFAGSVVSNLGTWLQNTAQALLAYQLTHSVLAIGAVVCAQFIWVLVGGAWAGRFVSRTHSVQRLVIRTQVASAVVAGTMAVLQFHHLLNEQLLVVGALGLGLAYFLTLPATAVLVPAFVPERGSDLDPARDPGRRGPGLRLLQHWPVRSTSPGRIGSHSRRLRPGVRAQCSIIPGSGRGIDQGPAPNNPAPEPRGKDQGRVPHSQPEPEDQAPSTHRGSRHDRR